MTRLAKAINNSGYCSRRNAEKLIFEGKVKVNNQVVFTPVTFVDNQSVICVDGTELNRNNKPKLWLYHKAKGLITTHNDPQGRKTVFHDLKDDLKQYGQHIISVGRLDINTEGLLLLTNSCKIASYLEHPKNNFIRTYKVRVYGRVDFPIMKKQLQRGVTINEIHYKPVEIKLVNTTHMNHWLVINIFEGKNREIKKILEHFKLQVNRLIRIQYGPFFLGALQTSEIKEVLKIPFKL